MDKKAPSIQNNSWGGGVIGERVVEEQVCIVKPDAAMSEPDHQGNAPGALGAIYSRLFGQSRCPNDEAQHNAGSSRPPRSAHVSSTRSLPLQHKVEVSVCQFTDNFRVLSSPSRLEAVSSIETFFVVFE